MRKRLQFNISNKDKDEKAKELTGIKLSEISLVSNPASRREFLSFKSKGKTNMYTVYGLIEEFVKGMSLTESEFERTSEALEVIKGLSDEAIDAIGSLLGVIAYPENVPKGESDDDSGASNTIKKKAEKRWSFAKAITKIAKSNAGIRKQNNGPLSSPFPSLEGLLGPTLED